MGLYTLAGCLVAAWLSLLISGNAAYIAARFGLIDQPDGARKLHIGSIPLLGGLAVVVPFLLLAITFILWIQPEPTLDIAVGAMAATAIIGCIDDRRGLSVKLRMLALCGIIATACMLDSSFVLHTLKLHFLPLQISLDPLATLATIVIVVGFVNAANLADGINGQLLGSVLIWCGFIFLYAPSERTPFLALLCCAAVALYFNLRGKLFSGSTGSYALPMFIGLSTIALYRRSGGGFHADLPVLWFWLPVVDCLRLFAWRALHNRSPFAADRNHIHHLLLPLVGDKFAAPVYLAMLAAPGAVGIFNETAGVTTLIACLALYCVVLSARRIRSASRALALRSTKSA